MRKFLLIRTTDVTGVSGVGTVAEGVQFSDLHVAMRWCVPGKPSSTVVYQSIQDVMDIHGHDGATIVRWLADEETEHDG